MVITNKEYANMLIEEGIYGESMRSYFEKNTLYAEKTSAGVIDFDKPSVRTRLCYGYGYGRDYEDAQKSAEAVRNDYDFFLSENIQYSGYEKALKTIKERPDTVYLRKTYNGNYVSLVYGCYGSPEKDYVKPTENDLEIIKFGLKAQLENLKKRCATYWKRYGGSKLDTWTYDVNY